MGYLHKEDWYARCGFAAWKVENRYPYTNRVKGESMMLDIVVSARGWEEVEGLLMVGCVQCMRKALR